MPEAKDLHVDKALSTVSVQYRNDELIGSEVMPMVPVGMRSDKYYIYQKDDSYKIPDDMVGPKAMPNEVDWKTSTDNYSVKDYALGDYVPQEVIDNADQPLSPLADTAEFLSNLLRNAFEVRIAAKVFTAANYPAANKVTLAGATQWSGASDNPLGDVMTAIEACFMRANTLVFGIDAWLVFRKLPEILDAVKSSTRFQSSGGLATQSEVAALFDVERVLVGRARKVTSKEGQTTTFGRIWGKHMSALFVPKGSLNTKSIAWGVTFSESNMLTYREFDGKRGVKGAHYVKNGWNTDEKIVASDVGYMIENAVA